MLPEERFHQVRSVTGGEQSLDDLKHCTVSTDTDVHSNFSRPRTEQPKNNGKVSSHKEVKDMTDIRKKKIFENATPRSIDCDISRMGHSMENMRLRGSDDESTEFGGDAQKKPKSENIAKDGRRCFKLSPKINYADDDDYEILRGRGPPGIPTQYGLEDGGGQSLGWSPPPRECYPPTKFFRPCSDPLKNVDGVTPVPSVVASSSSATGFHQPLSYGYAPIPSSAHIHSNESQLPYHYSTGHLSDSNVHFLDTSRYFSNTDGHFPCNGDMVSSSHLTECYPGLTVNSDDDQLIYNAMIKEVIEFTSQDGFFQDQNATPNWTHCYEPTEPTKVPDINGKNNEKGLFHDLRSDIFINEPFIFTAQPQPSLLDILNSDVLESLQLDGDIFSQVSLPFDDDDLLPPVSVVPTHVLAEVAEPHEWPEKENRKNREFVTRSVKTETVVPGFRGAQTPDSIQSVSSRNLLYSGGRILPQIVKTKSSQAKRKETKISNPCEKLNDFPPPSRLEKFNDAVTFVPASDSKTVEMDVQRSPDSGEAKVSSSHSSTAKKRDMNRLRVYRQVAGLSKEQLLHVDGEGDTILHLAIIKEELSLVDALLDRCERDGLISQIINITNSSNQTPLCMAVLCNLWEVAGRLIERGSDVNIRLRNSLPSGNGYKHFQLLHYVASKGQKWMATLLQLLSTDSIDVDAFNSEGQAPIHIAIESHGKPASNGLTIDSRFIIYHLVLHRANINLPDGLSDKTPLFYAIEKKNFQFLDWFLEMISSLQATGTSVSPDFDESSKSAAELLGECNATSSIMEKGTSGKMAKTPSLVDIVNTRTKSGICCLHIAAGLVMNQSEKEKILELLVFNGARLMNKNLDNNLKKCLMKIPRISELMKVQNDCNTISSDQIQSFLDSTNPQHHLLHHYQEQ